jgi:vitamin B12 transporter
LGVSYTNDLQKFTDDFSTYPNSHYERGVFEGQTLEAHWQNDVELFKGETLTAGLQAQQEWGREDDLYGYIADYGGGPVTTIGPPTLIDQTMTTGSYFLQSQTSIGDRFFATLGGRLDAVSSFGQKFTYRAAGAYFVPEWGTKLKASFGTGFKAPSLYQLYSPYGDPNLKAENSEGWDAGFEQPIANGALKVGATYFRNDFTDLIDFDNITYLYNNVSRAETLGWETFLSAKPLKGLVLRADYTYTWAVNLEKGEQLIRRPQNRADLSAFYQWDALGMGLSVAYVGDRPDLDFSGGSASPVTLDPYTLVNLMASYQLDRYIKFFGRVENLFDTKYEEVFGYGTAGLSFYAGTKISL